MDYREKIFEMLGVEPEEEFYLKRNGEFFVRLGAEKGEDRNLRFFITENLVLYVILNGQGEICFLVTLQDILLGNVEIVKIPKEIKPTKEEQIAIDYARACGYKYLVKDKNEDYVSAYTEKPIKNKKSCLWNGKGYWIIIQIPISFISWEDDEPYYIGGDDE